MPHYEFEFGIAVKANTPEEAMEKVGHLIPQLNELDYENDAAIVGPLVYKFVEDENEGD